MLTLTKKTEYALIAMAHLAARPGELASARRIARQYSLPLPVLMNILKTLNQSGLIDSVRGAKGGYRLAADPAGVTLSSLIEIVEGPIRLTDCAEFDHDAGASGRQMCRRMGACPIRGPVLNVHRKLHEFLATMTLADVIRDGSASATVPLGLGKGVKASPRD